MLTTIHQNSKARRRRWRRGRKNQKQKAKHRWGAKLDPISYKWQRQGATPSTYTYRWCWRQGVKLCPWLPILAIKGMGAVVLQQCTFSMQICIHVLNFSQIEGSNPQFGKLLQITQSCPLFLWSQNQFPLIRLNQIPPTLWWHLYSTARCSF